MTIRARRIATAGALAVAAVAAPFAMALSAGAGEAVAGPTCLSTVTTNGSEPQCVGYSSGNGVNVGTPWGVYGPNGGTGVGGYNGGVIAGPLLPGRTYTSSVG